MSGIPTSTMVSVFVISDGREIAKGTLPQLPSVGDIALIGGREHVVKQRSFSMEGAWVLTCSRVGK